MKKIFFGDVNFEFWDKHQNLYSKKEDENPFATLLIVNILPLSLITNLLFFIPRVPSSFVKQSENK
ncbi:MAG: hypothetical protein R3E32_09430 [Chitinophagales bacterium]